MVEIDTRNPDYLRQRMAELEDVYAELWAECNGWRARAEIAETGFTRDTKRLEWWFNHPNAALVQDIESGAWAIFFGPQLLTRWNQAPREASDDAMAKTEKRKANV